MQVGFFPRATLRRQVKYPSTVVAADDATAGQSSHRGHAVKIPRFVKNQARFRISAIARTGKGVESSFSPRASLLKRRGKLIHNSRAIKSAVDRGAVQCTM